MRYALLLTSLLFLVSWQAPDLEPQTAAGPDLLRILPEGCVALFSVHDLDEIRSRAEENNWLQFFSDDAFDGPMAAALDEITEEFHSGLESGELPFDPLALLAGIHGSVSCFVAATGEEAYPGLGVLITPGAERTAFDDSWNEVRAFLESEGALSEERHGAHPISLITLDPEGADLGETLAVFEVGGLVAAVGSAGRETTLELARGIMDRAAGTAASPGMSLNDYLLEARAAGGGARDVEAYVDLAQLIHLLSQIDPPSEEDQDVITTLGIDKLQWAWLSAGLGAGEALDLELHMYIPQEGYLAKWIDFLGPQPRELAGLIPAESSSIGLVGLNLWDLYQSILGLVKEKQPGLYQTFRTQIEGSKQTGPDFEQDLLAQFTGGFASFTVEVPESELEGMLNPMTMGMGFSLGQNMGNLHIGSANVIGLRDAEVVEIFLEELLAMGGMADLVDAQEVPGGYLNQLEMPGMFSAYWAFIDEGLVFSMLPTPVREALRMSSSPDAKSALDVDSFKNALAGTDDSPGVSVSDTRIYLGTLLAVAQMMSPDFFAQADVGANGGPEELSFIDPGLIDQYFSGTMLFEMLRSPSTVGMRMRTR